MANYHSDEWIMTNLKKHYAFISQYIDANRIIVLALRGSQNYGLDTINSDIDSRVIYIPSNEEIEKYPEGRPEWSLEFLNECKETISHFGENIKTYSLLYEFYENNKNTSKTDYYYSKIKNLYISDVEIESAVYPAIKQNDHLFLNEILRKLVLVSPEDIDYLFLLGKSYLNLGKYQLAKEQFITLFMLDRFSASYNYYLKLSIVETSLKLNISESTVCRIMREFYERAQVILAS